MNAPTTFQAVMIDIFKPQLVFFDDILIYSKDWESHMKHLEKVFKILQEQRFHVNGKKCSFGRFSIEYLGHIISTKGVEMDHRKVYAIIQWPILNQLKLNPRFLGLTGYYHRFIKGYGQLAQPLTALLKKSILKSFSGMKRFRWHSNH